MTNNLLERKNFAKLTDGTKVRTNAVRLSYANIWTPVAIEEGADKKYSASLLIRKDDKETLEAIEKATDTARKEGVGKFGGKIPAKLKLPLRDGDDERPDDEAYKNCYFINVTSKNKPGIINILKEEITDENEVYSGAWVIASLNFYAFNSNGNKGVAVGLNNLIKVADDTRLSGGISAEADFADLDFDVDLDDLF